MAKKKAVKKIKKTVRKAKKSTPKKSAKKGKAKPKTGKPTAPGLAPEKQIKGGVFLGEVEDFFSHVGVIALTLKKPLAVGDTIRVKGHTTDITQRVESLQIDRQTVQTAAAKDGVGIKIIDRARKGDAVYKV